MNTADLKSSWLQSLHRKGIDCNGRLPIEAPQYRNLDAMEETSTQPATQPVARKEGFDSILSEQDESDIICILLPTSLAAHEAVELTALAAPQHILQNHGMSHIYEAPDAEMTTGRETRPDDESDDVENLNTQLPDPNQSKWDGPAKDIALRFSSKVHSLGMGFTFGRNARMSDLLLSNDDNIRLSNRHFRIFMKDNGSLMIEDTSTNGTILDNIVLHEPKDKSLDPNHGSQHTLCNGSTIEIPLQVKPHPVSIRFSVKIPSRSETGFEKYQQNCVAYIKCVEQAERRHGFLLEASKNGNAPVNTPVSAQPHTHSSLPLFLTCKQDFMHALPQGLRPNSSAHPSLVAAATGGNSHGLHWNGGTKYNVVGFIGSGAFANVYKLSSKRDGVVFAVKQLDKKRLAKEGPLSNKAYNELNVIKGLRHVSAATLKRKWQD